MKIKRINFLLSLGASFAAALVAAPAFGQTVVVDDNVAVDGTASLDAQYFTSTAGTQAVEINPNSVGLVSGTSGRPMHGIFPAVTLTDVGDTITLSFSFMTPATVGTDRGNAFRLGFFNTLGRETPVLIPDPNNPGEFIQEVINGVPQTEGVFGNITANSSNPNPLYGDINNPGATPGLPGFIAEYDVNDLAGPFNDDNIRFRQSNPASPSGRFLTTTGGGSFFEISGRDDAIEDPVGSGNFNWGWMPNTTYSGFVRIARISATEVQVASFIDLPGFPLPAMMGDPQEAAGLLAPSTEMGADLTDPRNIPSVADSFTFDMFAFHAGSNTFGSSNSPSPGAAVNDNGLDFLSIRVETTGDVEATSVLGDFNGDGVVDCADLDGYVGNIGAAATGALAALDFDGDGFLSQTDADSVITTLVVAGGVAGTFPGDLNCDGTVNVLGDAFPLVANLNSSVTTYAAGDLNFDGMVNVLGDAFTLVANLGNTNQ
jgi:hypothetical protein